MKQRLKNNFWMKLLSLGLAVMLWMIIKLSANLSYTDEKPANSDTALTNRPASVHPSR